MNLKFLTPVVPAMMLAFSALGQTGIDWEKTMGGQRSDKGQVLLKTMDGGYFLAGNSESGKLASDTFDVKGNFGGSDFWVVKTNGLGEIEWQQHYGGTQNELVTQALQTADGGYVVVGYSFSYDGDISQHQPGIINAAGEAVPNADFWIIKITSLGVVQWETSLGGSYMDEAFSMIELPNEQILLAGFSASNNGFVTGNKGNFDAWLVKINKAGGVIWSKNYGGQGDDRATKIIPYSNGFLIAGFTNSNDGDFTENFGLYDYFLISIDHSGNLNWQKTLGGSRDDRAFSVMETENHGILLGGFTWSQDIYVNGGHGEQDAWLVKLDHLGNIIWEKSVGGSQNDGINRMQLAKDGSYLIAGYSFSGDQDIPSNKNSSDAWLAKIDPNGILIWSKSFGGSGRDEFNDFIELADGSLMVLGSTSSNDGNIQSNYGNDDFWLLKLSANVSAESIKKNVNDFEIFPQPSQGNIFFKGIPEIGNLPCSIRIFDAQGALLFSKEMENPESLKEGVSISKLENGVYFIQILEGNTVWASTFIIQK